MSRPGHWCVSVEAAGGNGGDASHLGAFGAVPPAVAILIRMTTRSELMAALRPVLEGRPEVELALLFGSRARQEGEPPGAGADVDVAVEGEGIDRLALARELSEAAGVEVEVVELTAAGYVLLRALVRDGLVIHEGRPHAEARFRTRTLLLTELDRPFMERMRDGYLAKLARRAEGG